MSTVERTVVINPNAIEPAMLSLRAPASMETWLALNFLNQNGSPYSLDPAAQLQLTARSDNRSVTYAMPTTDRVNGKARAVIPAGDLTDMNGYRLRLFGTVDQQPMLLAIGTLALIAAAGPDAMPEDVIDTVNLLFTRGIAGSIDIKLWQDAAKANPFDVASVTLIARIFDVAGGNILTDFSILQIGYNEIQLNLTDTQTTALPDKSWWTLVASTSAGQTTLVNGEVTAQ
jgi:hypothetical protein